MNEYLYATLKDRILFMVYPPGEILNEKSLAEEFGTSRTPIREVLMRLSWDKLVRILPRTGALVTKIEFYLMMNTFQVRFEIESLVSRLAAENATPAMLTAMDTVIQCCEALHGRRNHRKLVETDIAFRRILLAAANNPILEETANQLYAITQRLWYMVLERGNWDEAVDNVRDEFREARDIYAAGDASRAGQFRRAALIRHCGRIREAYLGVSP